MFRRDKWKEDDEYKRARWAYEGQGTGTTKAAWLLGAGFLAMTAFAAVQTYDKHQLATLGDLKFALIESCRGEIANATVTNGTLQTTPTMKRQFIGWWLEQWRPVPTDAVAYNTSYLRAQVYMSDPVYAAINSYMEANPIDKFIRAGVARTIVGKVQVTPRDSTGTSFRADWTEAVWRNSQLVAKVPMTADVELEQHMPKTEAEADQNMFGFVIRNFYWSPPPGI